MMFCQNLKGAILYTFSMFILNRYSKMSEEGHTDLDFPVIPEYVYNEESDIQVYTDYYFIVFWVNINMAMPKLYDKVVITL